MEQVCSNVFSSVGRCVQKDGTRFLCDITELLGMLWSAWMPGIPRACCGKEPRGRSGGKRAVITSFSSFTCHTNCFRKVKYCLFIYPSYSSSGRDPRLLGWERSNPSESCETLAWFFPSPGLGGLHHAPDTEIFLLLILQKDLELRISRCISVWQPASLCCCPPW